MRGFWSPSRKAKIVMFLWTVLCVPSFIIGFKASDGGHAVGEVLGFWIAPFVFAFVSASLAWLVFKRSQRAGQRTFLWVFVIVLVSQLQAVLSRVAVLWLETSK